MDTSIVDQDKALNKFITRSRQHETHPPLLKMCLFLHFFRMTMMIVSLKKPKQVVHLIIHPNWGFGKTATSSTTMIHTSRQKMKEISYLQKLPLSQFYPIITQVCGFNVRPLFPIRHLECRWRQLTWMPWVLKKLLRTIKAFWSTNHDNECT